MPSPARKHLAERWYTHDGLTISCRCGKYEPIKGSPRQQEDAHRAHRVAMGETVKPRKPSRVERLTAEVARLTSDLGELQGRAREALAVLDELIADHPDPGTRALAARDQLGNALIGGA